MADSEHAAAAIEAFIVPHRRARLLGLLASARGRAKLRESLAHLSALEPRHSRRLSAEEQNAASIGRLLRARGAPATCALLAEDPALDGQLLPLDDALVAVVGRGMGAFISCIPGRLAYFEGEEPGERYLLERAG